MIASFILAAAAAQAEPPAAARLAFPQAWENFRGLCLETLPSGERFEQAMGANRMRWVRAEQTREEIFGLGLRWRSLIGEITYRPNMPEAAETLRGPACHYTFRTSARYSHESAAAAVRAALDLPEGKLTEGKEGRQTQWDIVYPNGMAVRYFLSSDFEALGGAAARLSVSRRNPSQPKPDERIPGLAE